MSEGNLEQRHRRSVPYARFQYVTAEFAGANTDFLIEHQIETVDPEAIRYIIISSDRSTTVYHDQSATRKPWPRGSVILRSSAADAVVELLLILPVDSL